MQVSLPYVNVWTETRKKSLPGANKVSLSAGRGAGPWLGLARPRGGARAGQPGAAAPREYHVT